jgi:hypothetical protein
VQKSGANDRFLVNPTIRWRGQEWLLRVEPPRSATSASWLNAVEGFFAKLTKQRLKRGVCKGIVDLQTAINRYLQTAINRYLAEANDNPKPSSGPLSRMQSSKKSDEGERCWRRSAERFAGVGAQKPP